MKNVLGKLLLMGVVTIMTTGNIPVNGPIDGTVSDDSSYELTIENNGSDESCDTNIIIELEDDYFDE